MSEKYLLTQVHRNQDGKVIYCTFASEEGGLVTWVKKHAHAIQQPLQQIRRLARRFTGGELQIISTDELGEKRA